MHAMHAFRCFLLLFIYDICRSWTCIGLWIISCLKKKLCNFLIHNYSYRSIPVDFSDPNLGDTIPVQVTLYRTGRDGHLGQTEAYDMV